MHGSMQIVLRKSHLLTLKTPSTYWSHFNAVRVQTQLIRFGYFIYFITQSINHILCNSIRIRFFRLSFCYLSFLFYCRYLFPLGRTNSRSSGLLRQNEVFYGFCSPRFSVQSLTISEFPTRLCEFPLTIYHTYWSSKVEARCCK